MNEENRKRVEDIRAELAALPKGGLVAKARGGKTYHYHRWADNGVRHDDYVAPDRLGELKAQMDRKRSLQQELKALRGALSSAAEASAGRDASLFATSVRLAEDALADAQLAAGLRKRLGFQALEAFLRGPQQDKVLALYGLRRTGKTTMIRQAVLGMAPEDLRKTALMQVGRGNTLSEVNRDLLRLKRLGCRYVFIDEVTLLEDFIEGAALFSDVYAAGGMKIVLSGTDSLGFLISSAEELFDRCHLLHTTVIPYQEFEEVLGVRGIDKFIRFGGTMSMSGVHGGAPGTFAAKEQADAYVSSAIAENMQRSLRRCRDGMHFRRLRGLCDRGELADAISRAVEGINRRFALDILARDFRSS
ncbi:MAG: AAA family ATPase, partial [Duodenibacillus sp.]|nr:AAA family ATPase [Duodenibacillus sp.]